MRRFAFVLIAGSALVLMPQAGSAAPGIGASAIGKAGDVLTPVEQIHRRRRGHHFLGSALFAAPMLYASYRYLHHGHGFSFGHRHGHGGGHHGGGHHGGGHGRHH